MCIGIDGRPTQIHRHALGVLRLENLLLPGERICESEGHDVPSAMRESWKVVLYARMIVL